MSTPQPEIELKAWPQFYAAIATNEKRYELRRNDRPYAVGTILYIREFNPETQTYTGRFCRRKILYMMSEFTGLEPGYVLLSIAPVILEPAMINEPWETAL